MAEELAARTNHAFESTPKAATKHIIENIEHPNITDVLFGRSHYSVTHIGNLLWEQLVIKNTCLYFKVSRRLKATLVESIVKAVKNQESPGRFLQKDEHTKLWYDVGHKKAIENTHNALIKECMNNRKRFSNRRPLIIRDILEKIIKIHVIECQNETSDNTDLSRTLESDGAKGNLVKTIIKNIPSIPPLRQSITSEKLTTEVSQLSKSSDKKGKGQLVYDSNDESQLKQFEEPKISKKNEGHCMVPPRSIEVDGAEGNLVETITKDITSIPPSQAITSKKSITQIPPSSKLPDKKGKKQFVYESNDESWMKKFEELKSFKNVKGHCIVPQHYDECPNLSDWVTHQRVLYKLMLEGKPSSMTDKRLESLESLSFTWDMKSPKENPSSNAKELVNKKKIELSEVLI